MSRALWGGTGAFRLHCLFLILGENTGSTTHILFFGFFFVFFLNQPRLSSFLYCALLILKALRSDSDGDYTCEQFSRLTVQARSKGTVTKRRLTYFFPFFFLLQISFRLSPLLTQKDSPCKKKMLIITSEIGNGIRINKGEMTVIMVVFDGLSLYNQGENTAK